MNVHEIYKWAKAASALKKAAGFFLRKPEPLKVQPVVDPFVEVLNSMLSKNVEDDSKKNKFVTGSIKYSCSVESARDQACVAFISQGCDHISEKGLLLIKRELSYEEAEELFGDEELFDFTEHKENL